jgi:hypothetical protein
MNADRSPRQDGCPSDSSPEGGASILILKHFIFVPSLPGARRSGGAAPVVSLQGSRT